MLSVSMMGILDKLFRYTTDTGSGTAQVSSMTALSLRHTGKIYGARRNKFYPVSPRFKPAASLFLIIICCLIVFNTHAQQNNTLRGKILYLNSGKKPAVGVKIAGTVKGIENANVQYTTSNGSFALVFPADRDGHQVSLQIGVEDQLGQAIEVVNDKEVDICRIPAIASDECIFQSKSVPVFQPKSVPILLINSSSKFEIFEFGLAKKNDRHYGYTRNCYQLFSAGQIATRNCS